MESLDQCNGGQSLRPDGDRREHEESSQKTSHSQAKEIDGNRDTDLVSSVICPWHVEVLWHCLYGNDVEGVRCRKCHIGHDGDHHVFLLVEWSRIQFEIATENGEAPFREHAGEEAADGVYTTNE